MMKSKTEWSICEIRNFVDSPTTIYEYMIRTKQKLRFYYDSDGNAGRGEVKRGEGKGSSVDI